MKRIAVFLLLATAVIGAAAQEPWGTWSVIPHVGVSISSLSNDGIYYHDAGNEMEYSARYRTGFAGGVDVMYQASDALGLSAGVSYVQGGCKYKDIDLKGDIIHDQYNRLDYVVVPFLAHVYLASGFSVNFGAEPGFLVKAKAHSEYQFYDVDEDGNRTYTPNIEMDDDVKGGFRSFALSIPLGVSYEYEHVVLDARYQIGLTNAQKHGITSRNKIFEVSVGYKFSL